MTEYVLVNQRGERIDYCDTKEEAIISAKEYISVDMDDAIAIYELVCHTEIIKGEDGKDFVAVVEEGA